MYIAFLEIKGCREKHFPCHTDTFIKSVVVCYNTSKCYPKKLIKEEFKNELCNYKKRKI